MQVLSLSLDGIIFNDGVFQIRKCLVTPTLSTFNTAAVLDGDIDQFTEAALAQKPSAPHRKKSRTWSRGP